MREIELLQHLIEDVNHEVNYITKYQEEVARAKSDNSRYAKLWKMRNPSRQRIKDSLKMIRRISIDIERRIQDE